jgi:hypothetical protein
MPTRARTVVQSASSVRPAMEVNCPSLLAALFEMNKQEDMSHVGSWH